MKTKTIFISGPMTGIEDFNFPAFHAAAEKLRAEGYAVVSPATLFGGDTDIDYETMLRVDMAAMLACDEIYLLDGWLASPGSRREKAAAIEAGMVIRSSEVERAMSERSFDADAGEFTKADADEFAKGMVDAIDKVVSGLLPIRDSDEVPPGYIKLNWKEIDKPAIDLEAWKRSRKKPRRRNRDKKQ